VVFAAKISPERFSLVIAVEGFPVLPVWPVSDLSAAFGGVGRSDPCASPFPKSGNEVVSMASIYDVRVRRARNRLSNPDVKIV